MRTILLSVLSIICVISMYSQDKYTSFIIDVQKVFNANKLDYQKLSNKVMGKCCDNKHPDNLSFIYIPELLLKKPKKLYENIDSTNVVQYFDSKSMFYNKTLVCLDSFYVGQILSYSKTDNEYQPKPNIDNEYFGKLFFRLKEIDPDMIFTVQNVNGYFYIKNSKLYVLYDYTTYTIDEYTIKFKNYIFFLFRYEPRVKKIICY